MKTQQQRIWDVGLAHGWDCTQGGLTDIFVREGARVSVSYTFRTRQVSDASHYLNGANYATTFVAKGEASRMPTVVSLLAATPADTKRIRPGERWSA